MRKAPLLLTTLFTATFTTPAIASPEADSARIAGNLRAFSDQDWAKIAGDHLSEHYPVARGDTLWGVSARLFGDAKVWPKVWEINNSTVLNPHMIEPRMALLFNSGSGLSLPSLAFANAINSSGTSTVKNHYSISKDDRPGAVWDEKTPFPSSEWRNLPRQSWENVAVNLPPNIDKDGFDTRNRIYLRKPATGLELPHYIACAPVQPLARVEGSRSVTSYAYRNSEVTVRSTGTPLEMNRLYTLVDPSPSELSAGGRTALSYDVLGKIKILGVQNGTYVGEIQNTRELVPRGALLIPEIKRIEKQAPLPGATKVKGTILADRRTGAFMSGQHKWVYINRGTKDGVAAGMIFRVFQNTDPKTNRPLTSDDVFVSGDAQVVQGCSDFSIGTFIWSRGEIPEQYEGVLLTDVADEKIRFYFNGEASDLAIKEPPAPELTTPSGIIDRPKPEPREAVIGPGPTENPEVLAPIAPPEEKKSAEQDDWLDKLDNHQELRSEEENELRELEKFRESEAAKAEPPIEVPSTEGAELPTAPTPESAGVSPAPAEDFPSQEPIVETPSTAVNANPPTQSATAPKPSPMPLEDGASEEIAPL